MNGREVNDECCGLEMKNGLEAGIDYPAKYMHAPNPNKPGPCNYEAEMVDAPKAMNMSLGK